MCVNDTCRVDTLQGVGYAVVFLLGFLVNAAALLAFIAKRKSWTDMHIYMLNLAIADFALVLFLPFRIYDAFFCLTKTKLCTFLINTHFINMYASIYTTAAISFQRYLVIRFPLQARSWRRKKEIAFVVCLVVWVVLAAVCLAYSGENDPKYLWTCYERCKNKPLDGHFMVILEVMGIILPLLIVVFCSSRIIYILKVDRKSAEKRSTVNIVTANMIVFIVCYLPIHIGFTVNYFNEVPKDWMTVVLPEHLYLQVSEWIASTNCCFDSVSYYFLLKRFYSQVSAKTNASFRTMSMSSLRQMADLKVSDTDLGDQSKTQSDI